MEELTPITRKEVFLAKASGQDVETPTPVTREEVFLDEIAKGGGGGLPSTETASAGDVLSLDDNKEPQWAPPSSGGGVLVVHGTYDEQAGTVTLDKTFNDILTAVNAGKIPVYIEISGEDNASAMYFDSMYADLKYLVSFMSSGSDGAVNVIQFAADTADDELVWVIPQEG